VRHTNQNIKDDLQNVVRQWGLQNKVAACTTDNAANITAAIRFCMWIHIPCFAHSLNLIVQYSLEHIQKNKKLS